MTFRETIHHYIRSHRDDHIEKLREYLLEMDRTGRRGQVVAL
jgi:hypothetical protein